MNATNPASSEQHPAPDFAVANGIRICYDSFGARAAEPLVLIMGLATQMTAWDPAFCTQLAARGYWVIRFDNRDIGLSTHFTDAGAPDVGAALTAAMQDKPIATPYYLRDMAADVIGLLDFLGIDKAHVVGASMGGAIAQLLAIHSPQRLLSLTSIMATTGSPGLPPPTPEAMAVLMKPAPSNMAAYMHGYEQTMKVLRAGAFPDDEALDAKRAAENFARGLNPAGAARQLVAILASGSRKAALAAVRVPTLVIHGDADPLVPLACGIDTAETVPGAKLRVIAGMGHAMPMSMWPLIVDEIAAHAAQALHRKQRANFASVMRAAFKRLAALRTAARDP
jgi:pimeloyl-ACP methyl ester carboxylesterase